MNGESDEVDVANSRQKIHDILKEEPGDLVMVVTRSQSPKGHIERVDEMFAEPAHKAEASALSVSTTRTVAPNFHPRVV